MQQSGDTRADFADVWSEIPKVVSSTTLEQVEGYARLARDGIATPYFPAMEQRINLELVETQTCGNRVVYMRYRRMD